MFGLFFPSLFSHAPVSLENDPIVDPFENSCCICYRTYIMGPRAEEPVAFRCGHVFGATCIDKWRQTSTTCPLCRAELDFADDDDLYEQHPAAPTHSFTSSFSQAEDISWQNVVATSDSDGRAESEGEDIWFDALEEIVTSPRSIISPISPEVSITPLDIINPGRLHIHPNEDIWDTARNDNYVFDSLPSPAPSFLILDEEILGLDSPDCFSELQIRHENWIIEFHQSVIDDEDIISYFDVFPY